MGQADKPNCETCSELIDRYTDECFQTAITVFSRNGEEQAARDAIRDLFYTIHTLAKREGAEYMRKMVNLTMDKVVKET